SRELAERSKGERYRGIPFMVRHGLSSPSQRLSEPEAEQTVRPFESLPGPTRPGTGRANGFSRMS
ncbi:MAG: hypothetical protein Q8N70_02170, partial [Deltaproteobacteria bacterium]|nr:hypothetical protein [Deltaproteobacteria bacterium]